MRVGVVSEREGMGGNELLVGLNAWLRFSLVRCYVVV